MATITKFLIALLFFSLLVLQLAEADHDTVVSSNLAASSPPTKIVIAISKSLVASILMISLIVLHLVEADQNMLNLML
ncbi:hypothetical protein POTOM_022083 [Populus tomentosa]|uniref:Transmembrane protein n=1 Tax=Populus tomentosa TaxID=118781 RepID=A0A8X7ZUZ4_POPTO|nr:hypothetical protein POTOM_022083 [Populus tomentosa]